MLRIYKASITVIILILFSINVQGQKKQIWNKPLYDEYPYHYGFALGFNYFSARSINSESFFALDTVYSMETAGQPGFSILMVGNVRLSKDFDLRFTPGLIFGQRNLHYLVKDDATSNDLREHIMRIESTYASFPILLKYRSRRLNNYRPYIIAGVNYTFDLESEKKIRDDEKPKIRLNRNDIYVEFGFGSDYYFPFFKFTTELKFSFGLLNIIRPDDTEYTKAIEKLNGRMVSLLFYFE